MSLPEITGFEIIEKLGVGGMASVWKARQLSLDRVVAIKVLSTQFASDAKDIDRFQKEAQAAAKLKHPGIVQVYDANAENGMYFFVMEYVAGYTVGDWVRRRGALSVADALLVVECVVDALEYAWRTAGIIHCDIKPDNVIIDADGTVKVADLGLARTISAMAEAVFDEVMGTPAYMAPEQVAGVADLDCRADIYSLGAMLYHLITGRMLFQGSPDESVMDMQLQDCVPDALDVHAEVDTPVCWLLERMLAKDRNMRHPDWDSVARDIDRVKEGRSPAGHLPHGVVSTMLRSPKRTLADFRRKLPTGEVHTSNTAVLAAVVSGALLLATAGGVYWWLSHRNGGNGKTVPVKHTSTTTTTQAAVQSHQPAGRTENKEHRRLFKEASDWARTHPSDLDESIRRFEALAELAKLSKQGDLAAAEAARLRARRDEIVGNIMRGLDTQARPLIETGSLVDAAAVYEHYAGDGAEQTRKQRLALADDLRKRAEALEEKDKNAQLTAEKARAHLIKQLVDALTESGVAEAEATARQAVTDDALGQYSDDFVPVAQLLASARRAESNIILGFQKYAGQSVTIDLETGRTTVTVTRVKDEKVEVVESGAAGDRHFSFMLEDLSAREKLMRLGQSNEPHVALLKGLMALRSNAYTHATKYFNLTNCLLTAPLLARVEAVRLDIVDREAEKALRRVLRTIAVSVEDYDEGVWLDAVSRASITEDEHAMVRDALDTFDRAYGTTRFAQTATPVIDKLRTLVE